MIRACLSVFWRTAFGRVDRDLSQSLAFARMYGELTASFIRRNEGDNAYVLACRGFHHARLVLDDGREQTC